MDESWIDAMERKEAKEKEAGGTHDGKIMGISWGDHEDRNI